MSHDVRHRAGWLPADQSRLEEWLEGHVRRVDAAGEKPLRPSVAALADLVRSEPVVGMLVHRMLEQRPETREYHSRHIRDVDHLLALMNGVLELAPEYGEENVTLPMGALLDWAMGTPAGFAAFRDPRVNAALKGVLREWCEFLDSPGSLYVLNDGPAGWKGEKAVADVGMDQFQHDPDDEHWGFSSWNDFFVRRFREGERPVAAPEDDAVVVSACESTPFALRTDVQRREPFWLKGQPYSLHEMLDGDDLVDRFVGGTVYQAFLSATDYHRWHAPVAGTVVSARVVDGTYYSEASSVGSDAADESPSSQGYLAHVATRAIVTLRADNPALGHVAFVAVGMSDVSSCVTVVEPGQHVAKGEEIGYFQFGGSTHCLVFEPGALSSSPSRPSRSRPRLAPGPCTSSRTWRRPGPDPAVPHSAAVWRHA
ncbi:phosphatidylserine decarboxylase family protein [Pseudokineococcus basanitobsidens]|uniref:Phosphatidylserine decarboxylase family protein n=1 Tax=Pseudokineococcus basanitobsidens TaxID=1926649 RepID=A0ABU8RG03_9ACTN